MKPIIIFKTIVYVLFVCAFQGQAQIKNIGIPFIVNHARNTYNASTQNWSVTQSNKGFIYFGNNEGVLEYDGTGWRIFPASNASVVRSVLATHDTVYLGAFEEIAFLASGKNGNTTYHSLTHLVPEGYKEFDEIWKIYKKDNRIYFQSFNYIFILQEDSIRVVEPLSKFGLLHYAEDQFFVVDTEQGLMRLDNDNNLHLVSNHPIFFRNEIRAILPYRDNKFLICTSNEGMFLWDRNQITAWQSPVNDQIKKYNLFSALLLHDGNFVLGSISNGVYISNPDGTILQHLNRFKGLQNNTILTIFEDRRNNLWLGLDNGIDYIEISSPLSVMNNYNMGSPYASILHKGIMYVGTNQGLYALEANRIFNSTENQNFRLISGTEGQVWTLEIIDNILFCGHNSGSFQIEGFSAHRISDIRGFWSFIKSPGTGNYILAGTYTGLVRLSQKQGRWFVDKEIQGFRESSRKMLFDKNKNMWISHGYKGLFRVLFSADFSTISEVDFFGVEDGLPSNLPYNIQIVHDELVVSTQNGLYHYDENNNVFFPAHALNLLFEEKGFIDRIYEDNNGNLWYFTPGKMGMIGFSENSNYKDITAPFARINEHLLPAFNNIFISNPENIFIGSQLGLVHYDSSLIKDSDITEQVYITEVTFYDGSSRSALYNYTRPSKLDEVPFSKNSVLFRYTQPAFEIPGRIRFAYKLQGFDNEWSAWESTNFKEYTNLREGNYTFEIKAINAFGIESEIESFSFTIKPPFFRSTLAYSMYAILMMLAVAGNIVFVKKRTLRVRQYESQKHARQLARREQVFKEKSALSEKEIIQLRNEKLQSEMQFKNKELANSTLHLIQKNKTLTSLKNELNKLMKESNISEQQNVVSKLIKKINKDIQNEKQWELFNTYFDEVHQDFTNRLKEKYTELSPKELRLCAYLRMNISSKEIAPLMNISVRGVEISRYRLRKKLNLNHETNLTDFILSF